MTYTYLGDRLTDPELKGRICHAVRREDGKCIRGTNGNMLVEFDGIKRTVIGRLLRKVKPT
jgi:NADPH-dependent glutamate synthase beta subunit-like oxidoreductase